MATNEENYFQMAHRWSKKATCPRASVGCVVVLPNGKILGGFNGAPDELPSCEEAGCLMEGGHCVRAVHAEMRVIAMAASSSVRMEGGKAFVTLLPCVQCLMALFLSGVRVIYYDKEYERDEREQVHLLAERAGIKLLARTRT